MAEIIGKREQKKLLAKNTIMETAIEQFIQQGFQATSIADIMKAAALLAGQSSRTVTAETAGAGSGAEKQGRDTATDGAHGGTPSR